MPHRERLGDGVAPHGRRVPRDAPPARRVDRDRRSRSRATSASRPSRRPPDSFAARGSTCLRQRACARRRVGGNPHAEVLGLARPQPRQARRRRVDRRAGHHDRARRGHHPPRVRHRPGQLPQQGRGDLQEQRRLPGPVRRPGHGHAGHARRGPGPHRPVHPGGDRRAGSGSRPRSRSRAATRSSRSSRRSPRCEFTNDLVLPDVGQRGRGCGRPDPARRHRARPHRGGQGRPQRPAPPRPSSGSTPSRPRTA